MLLMILCGVDSIFDEIFDFHHHHIFLTQFSVLVFICYKTLKSGKQIMMIFTVFDGSNIMTQLLCVWGLGDGYG
jgi:hypothetical protein